MEIRNYIKKLYLLYMKYKEVILYLIFGGLTTLVNIVGYILLSRCLRMDTMSANGIALALSILFAYVTNKLFVFESRTDSLPAAVREFCSFIACRLVTMAIDMLIMYVTVDVLGWFDVAMKVLANIIVIALNFIFSKLIIFKKSDSA